MASVAFKAQGLLMDIGMACGTFRTRLSEDQRRVAERESDGAVLSLECKSGGTMSERDGIFVYSPSLGSMAILATIIQVGAMGRLGGQIHRQHDEPS